MRHRVFTAINLPDSIKNKLAQYQEKWPELPARWTKKGNLHITLEFFGYLTSQEMVEVCQGTKKTVSEKKSFFVCLNKICYSPVKNPKKSLYSIPKMIWATGQKIKEFNLTPHITLGRIKAWQFRQIEPEERPQIDQEIDLSFEVNSIEVMESRLRRGGPEYAVLESISLFK